MTGTPRVLLRLEGMALLAMATAGFVLTGQSWWLYAILFFAPDASFAAYGAGPRVGAVIYNALHSTIGPAVLAGTGLLVDSPGILAVAAIWAAHIGFDRMLGYGLKYASGFGDTHLGRIGRKRTAA
ncbi:MAG TPA: DUF4260 domain-containing protein [Microvirga sp.]|nr:DUF4260 domain-containing protein [Microvirga sp.]